MMHQERCFIFSGGHDFYPHLLQQLPNDNDMIIAADSGLNNLVRSGSFRPDLILGDMDSFQGTNPFPGVETMRYPKEKNDTDTMLAVKTGLALGFRSFYIAGGLGGRLDHTLANVSILQYLHTKRARGVIDNGKNRCYYIEDERFSLVRSIYPYVSVIPAEGGLSGLTLTGFLYPLENADVQTGDFYTVSNQIIQETAVVHLPHGKAFVIESMD